VVTVDPGLGEAGWRDFGRGARCAARSVGYARASREEIVDTLVSRGVLWPLVDCGPSCRRCGSPRRPSVASAASVCRSCRELTKLYDDSLADLYPITYTAPQWALCAGVRALKDLLDARCDNLLARDLGAVLSAYLEHHLGGQRLGVSGEFGVVTAVPSSRPVIAAALRRAAQEGWWSPEFAVVARARPGHLRQRRRPDAVRMHVRGKWEMDHAAVDGLDVLVLDDIYTSGGSVHSFAYALRNAGAASVRAAVLARNVGRDDGEWVLPLLQSHRNAGCRWTAAVGKHDVIAASGTTVGPGAGR